MFKVTRDLTLPTTITGSLPRPVWYTENLGSRPFRDAMADARYREQYTDAVGAYVRDQERAGLDKGDIIFEVMESRVMPRCVEKIERGPLQYSYLWKVAQGLTARPVKFGTITPELIGTTVGNDYYPTQKELLYEISAAMREELVELARAGCLVIQMEEPNIHLAGVQRGGGAQLDVEFFVEIFNTTVAGLRDLTEVWCHTCWGNPAQQRLFAAPQSYKDALPHLARLDVDVLTFECATTDGMDLEMIGRTIQDKKVAVGVVDHRNLQVERPEQVAALIRKALKHIPLERLILSTDCGFGREGMSRRIAFYKMVSIVRGANIVRHELGLPEAECRAADSRFALVEEA